MVYFKCNKCGAEHSVLADLLHIKRTNCSNCEQRYFIDPFNKLTHQANDTLKCFDNFDNVVLWGAGEICIKLIDTYKELKNDKYKVVDISKSRQGYMVCDKIIYSPEIINSLSVTAIVICVVQRKDDVLVALKELQTSEFEIYIPKVSNNTTLILSKIN